MAPEMVSGDPVDPRTDVYLLGATLHMVLTGKTTAWRAAGHRVVAARARVCRRAMYEATVPEELATAGEPRVSRDPCAAACDSEGLPRRADRVPAGTATRARWRRRRSSASPSSRRCTRCRQPDEGAAKRFERLSLEARFGLEQALTPVAGERSGQAALAKVEAILEQRRLRSLRSSTKRAERDPPRRRVSHRGLAGMTVLALGRRCRGLVAGQPTPKPAWWCSLGDPGPRLHRHVREASRLLDTRFNRDVFSTLVGEHGLHGVSADRQRLRDLPIRAHFSRDSFVTAGGDGGVRRIDAAIVRDHPVLFAVTGHAACCSRGEHVALHRTTVMAVRRHPDVDGSCSGSRLLARERPR